MNNNLLERVANKNATLEKIRNSQTLIRCCKTYSKFLSKGQEYTVVNTNFAKITVIDNFGLNRTVDILEYFSNN